MQKKEAIALLFLVLLAVILLGCTSLPSNQSRVDGLWSYEMTGPDGRICDLGTIAFIAGRYTARNIHSKAMRGSFSVAGGVVQLGGRNSWQAILRGDETLSGELACPSGELGLWIASREP